MNIRNATVEDVDAVHELGKTVDEFSVNEETVNFWPKERLASAIDSDDVLILVAEENAAISGFLIINYNRSLKKALIENIYVDPARRGEGIGAALLQTLMSTLRERGCEYVATLVPPGAESAIGVYVQSGFGRGEVFLWLDKALTTTFKREGQ